VNILDRIALTKQEEVDQLDAHQATVEALKDRLLQRGHRDFMAALRSPARGRVALIAEVKKSITLKRGDLSGFRS
jgi:indole-3-glycerol phosphate synthase